MLCSGFERRMHELLDQRQRPELDPQLVAHGHACATCRELLAAQEQLFDFLDLADRPTVRRDFARNTVETAMTEGVSRRKPSRKTTLNRNRQQAVMMALALTLMLAILPLGFMGIRSMNDRKPTIADTQLEPASSVPRHQDSNPQMAMLQSTIFAPDAGSISRLIDDRIDRRQVGEIAIGLRPIATSFSVAWSTLRRAWLRNYDEPTCG